MNNLFSRHSYTEPFLLFSDVFNDPYSSTGQNILKIFISFINIYNKYRKRNTDRLVKRGKGGSRLEIRQLRYFVVIAEEGTISAAARRLNMSQPPLSMAIHQLEEELGTILFERGARQIVLTQSGQSFYKYATEMLELERTAREEMKGFSQGVTGNVRVGLISTADCPQVWKGLAEFHRQFPKMQLLISEANTMDLLEMIRRTKIELAFIRTPYPTHDFDTICIRSDSFCAAGLPEILPQGGKITLQELSDLPLITYRRREPLIRNAMDADLVGLCDDARTALQMAQNGLGVALVPESAAGFTRGLNMRPIDSPSLSSQLHLIKRKDTMVGNGAEAMFDIFRRLQPVNA